MEAVEEIEDRIAHVVENPGRRAAALAQQREIHQAARDFFRAVEDHRNHVRRLNLDFGTSGYAYDRAASKLVEKQLASSERIIRAAMEMRRTLTREDWEALKGDRR